MPISRLAIVFLSIAFSQYAAADETIVQDGDVNLSYEELEYQIKGWTPQMRDSAIQDQGDRMELLNLSLANKKVALAADEYVKEHPDLYWEYQAGLEAYQRNFLLYRYRDSLEYPDFGELAKERYTVNKDKYAKIPERRTSSHILIASPPGVSREPALAKANEVLEKLRNGADWEEMVKEYSGEPGAVEKKGKFDKWMEYGEIGVSPPYSEGLFTIEKIGEFSEPVQTQFGVHIIRLDGIREQSYKPFSEVEGDIVKELKAEYQKLAMKEFISQFQMSEDVIIDNEAIDKLLEPYAKQE